MSFTWKLYAFGSLCLTLLSAMPAYAAPGDPRFLQGSVEWPAVLTGEPIVIVRADDGHVYSADVGSARRQGAEIVRVGGRVALLVLEGSRPHEVTAIVIGAGDAASLSRALSLGLPHIAAAPAPAVAPAVAAVPMAVAPPAVPAPPAAVAPAAVPAPLIAVAPQAAPAPTHAPAPAALAAVPPAAGVIAVPAPVAAAVVAATPPLAPAPAPAVTAPTTVVVTAPAAPAASAATTAAAAVPTPPAAAATHAVVAAPSAAATAAAAPLPAPTATAPAAAPPAAPVATSPAPAAAPAPPATTAPPAVPAAKPSAPPAPRAVAAAPAPGTSSKANGPFGTRQQWARVDGRVMSVDGALLVLRADNGSVVHVDISQLNPNVSSALRRERLVSVYGYPLEQKFEAAGYIELDPSHPEPPRWKQSR